MENFAEAPIAYPISLSMPVGLNHRQPCGHEVYVRAIGA